MYYQLNDFIFGVRCVAKTLKYKGFALSIDIVELSRKEFVIVLFLNVINFVIGSLKE